MILQWGVSPGKGREQMEKMDNNVESILDMMTELLETAWSIPLSGGKSAIETERFHEMIQDIRLRLPEEIAKAREIVNDRRTILDDAKKEADMVIRVAEDRAKKLVDHDEIVKQAQMRANEILSAAQLQVRELKKATGEYVDSVLQQTEEQLSKSLTDVRTKRNAIKGLKQ